MTLFLAGLALTSLSPAAQDLDAALLLDTTPTGRLTALGDFDGDGTLDAIGLSQDSLIFARGNASGSFDRPTAGASLPGTLPQYRTKPAVADFDGDNVLDVFLATFNSSNPGTLYFFRGLGDGTFETSQDCGAAFFQSGPVAVQWDADLLPELAYSAYVSAADPAKVRVFDFGLGCLTPLAASDPIGGYGTQLLAEDFDDDGIDELILHDQQDREIEVYRSEAGALQLSAVLPILQPNGLGSGGIAIGDLDGDQDPDLLGVAQAPSVGLTVPVALSSYVNDGSGAFSLLPVEEVVALAPGAIYGPRFELADWDGDGRADLVGPPDVWPSNGAGVIGARNLLFRNAGGGAFDNPVALAAGLPARLAGIADLNGDGNIDVVSAGSLVFGNGLFEEQVTFGSGYSPANQVLDAEGDGDTDLLRVTLNPGGGPFNEPPFGTLLANDGTGTFSSQAASKALQFPGPGSPRDWVSGDFDGDGREDYVVEIQLFSDNPFVPPVFLGLALFADLEGTGPVFAGNIAGPETQFEVTRPRALDVDGDGRLDVVDLGSVWFGDGQGGLAAPVELFPNASIESVGDVDGDGDADLLTRAPTFSTGGLVALQRAVPGGYAQEPLLDSALSIGLVEFLDVDEDGDLDALIETTVAWPSYPQLALRLNDGSGAFAVAPALEYQLFAPLTEIAQGDANGDGLGDLYLLGNDLQNNSYARAAILPRTGPGATFGPYTAYLFGEGAGFADVDADGDLDVVAGRPTLGTRVQSPAGGGVRQYGEPLAGAGGARPLFGGVGPLVPGSATAGVRLTRGLGGATAILLVGTSQGALPGVVFPELTLYVDGLVSLPVVTLDGPVGAPGLGTLEIPLTPSAATVGAVRYGQAILLDGTAPAGIAATNGLELIFGL